MDFVPAPRCRWATPWLISFFCNKLPPPRAPLLFVIRGVHVHGWPSLGERSGFSSPHTVFGPATPGYLFCELTFLVFPTPVPMAIPDHCILVLCFCIFCFLAGNAAPTSGDHGWKTRQQLGRAREGEAVAHRADGPCAMVRVLFLLQRTCWTCVFLCVALCLYCCPCGAGHADRLNI